LHFIQTVSIYLAKLRLAIIGRGRVRIRDSTGLVINGGGTL
jgi:hypothetical protein